MTKKGLSLDLNASSKRILQMVREWPKRTKALQDEFTYDSAEYVRKDILRKLPSGQEFKAYRDDLTVAKVDGLPEGESAHIVHVPIKGRDVRKADARQTLLYVRGRRKNRTRSAKVDILESFGPWPVDMLPFKPPASEAKIISRRVAPAEIEAIRKRLERRRPRWMAALAAAGAADKKAAKKTKSPSRIKAIPDVAFTALRLEFGAGGTRAKAHWRPAILDLVRDRIPKEARRVTKYDKAMTDPKNTEWLSWPEKTKGRVRSSELKRYGDFQDRLGLRLRG